VLNLVGPEALEQVTVDISAYEAEPSGFLADNLRAILGSGELIAHVSLCSSFRKQSVLVVTNDRILRLPDTTLFRPLADPSQVPMLGLDEVSGVRVVTDKLVLFLSDGRTLELSGMSREALWSAQTGLSGVIGGAGASPSRRFRVTAVAGLSLAVDAEVTLAIRDTEFVVTLADDDDDGVALRLDYSELDAVSVGGPGLQTRTTDAGIVGGGFGVKAFLKGATAAALVNAATRRTEYLLATTLTIAGAGYELHLLTQAVTPFVLDGELAAARTVIRASKDARAGRPHDLAGQIRELAELHSSGVLTDEEFELAKQRVIAPWRQRDRAAPGAYCCRRRSSPPAAGVGPPSCGTVVARAVRAGWWDVAVTPYRQVSEG
jgi:hypothetical protein